MCLNEIYNSHKEQVHFFCVYVREAHPDDGWRVPDNLDAEIRYKEPTSNDERTEVAHVCQLDLNLQMPMLIDDIDNEVEDSYIAMPMRLYLVDSSGQIAYAGGQGPFNFHPDELEAAIQNTLAAD